MDKSIKGEGAYRPLVAEFNGYWDTPLESLPERLQRLIRADRGLLPDWDRHHQSVRRLLVKQQEDQSTPSHLRTQEHEDFDREAQRQALVAERDLHSRLAPQSSIDVEAKRQALARINAELAALDREQATAEQQSDTAGQLTMKGATVEPLPVSKPDRVPKLATDREGIDGERDVPKLAPMAISQSSVETGARGGAARAAKYKPFKDWVQSEAASVPGHPRSIARALADRLPAKFLDISADPARMIYSELVRMKKLGTRG